MTARVAYAQVVYEDAGMNALGFVQSRVFQASAVDTPVPDTPFIVIRSRGIEKAYGITGVDTVEYWVHRPRSTGNDYSIIDAAIVRLREVLTEVTHFSGSDGYVLSAASWLDVSDDLVDDTYNTLVKYATFRAATRSVVTP